MALQNRARHQLHDHLYTTSPDTSLADSFASFFTGKISKLSLSLTSNPTTSSPHSPSPPATPPDFSVLTPVSESKIHKILSNCPNKQFDADPILIQILYQAYQRMFIRTHPHNHQHCQPLISSQFHPTLKEICHHATP